MSTEHAREALPPARRRQLARVFWIGGIVTCVFVGAAILSGTPVRLAAQYLPPGMLAISFSLFLQWTADLEVSDDA